MILSAGLKANGFEVMTAATAEKALALCEAFPGPIDLLLTDIGLTPQELWSEERADDSSSHGVALAERALQIRPSLNVVLFTGYSDERLKRLGAVTGRFLLLRKPSPAGYPHSSTRSGNCCNKGRVWSTTCWRG